MKFPFILFFRYDKYKSIDAFFQDNCNKLNCTLHIINKKEKLNKIAYSPYEELPTEFWTAVSIPKGQNGLINKLSTIKTAIFVTNFFCCIGVTNILFFLNFSDLKLTFNGF